MALLEQAGLYNPRLYSFPFLNKNSSYTVFIPSDQALSRSHASSMPKEELASFLKYHFVKGVMIFTDNKQEWKNYKTMREDESSTPFNTYYTKLMIRPGPDIIEILDTAGVAYVSIPEIPGKTIIMVATDARISSVIHEIDNVLIKQ